MQPFLPDFEIVKMDAEIGSYQEDQDPERDDPERVIPTFAPALNPSESDV